MKLKWTDAAVSDLARRHDFLSPVDPQAAAALVQSLSRAPERLLRHPRIGEKLDEFGPR